MKKNVFTIILVAFFIMLPNSMYSQRARKFLPCGCEIILNEGKKSCGLCGRTLSSKTREISKSGFEQKSETDYWCDNKTRHKDKKEHKHIGLSDHYDYGRDKTHVCNEECIIESNNKNSTEQTVRVKNVCLQRRAISVVILKDGTQYGDTTLIKPDKIWKESFPLESKIRVILLRIKRG